MEEVGDDAAILNFIFNPGSSISFAPPRAPSAAAAAATGAHAEALAAHRQWSEQESAAVALAEEGRLPEALAGLDDVCARAPTRASAFNNRAQARRLAGNAAGARADLDAAIELGAAWLREHGEVEEEGGALPACSGRVPAASAPLEGHPLAAFHRRVLCQAHTQRAALHHAAGAAEQEASDLHAAAQLGSALARAVESGANPFATMCHAAVQVMMQEAGAVTQTI